MLPYIGSNQDEVNEKPDCKFWRKKKFENGIKLRSTHSKLGKKYYTFGNELV